MINIEERKPQAPVVVKNIKPVAPKPRTAKEAVPAQVKHAIVRKCGGILRQVNLKTSSANSLEVTLIIEKSSADQVERLGKLILALPELKPYEVFMKVVTKS
jgi:hypothetical protein